MAERFKGLNFKSFDVGIKSWSNTAEQIIKQFGRQSVVEPSSIVSIGGIPLLTGGAYSCYAGIAQSRSGIYFFHLYDEADTYKRLVVGIGGEPIAGMVGGIPLKEKRKHENQFKGKPLTPLEPRRSALGGLNVMVLPSSNEVLYAAGYFNANEVMS